MTIIYILSALMLFAVGNISQSNYGKIAFSVSERWKENRTLANVMNWFSRHMEDIAEEKIIPQLDEDLKSKSREENAERRVRGYAILRMVKYLLSDFKQIELWNPKGDKQGLLGKKDLNRIETGEETGYKKGGISPFRLCQIAIAVGQRYIDENPNGVNYTVESINDADLLKIAKAYHAEKQAERKARAKKSESESVETDSNDAEVEQIDAEIEISEYSADELLDMLETKEIKTTDIESPETLAQMRELTSGGRKGAITKQLNKVK